MKNKAIFLDIDGVLNADNPSSKSRCGIYAGIDKDKVKRLAKIVEKTDAAVILTSSWKKAWAEGHKERYRKTNFDYIDLSSSSLDSDYIAKYLDQHLKKKGPVVISDITKEPSGWDRGLGIQDYLLEHDEITDFVVLDDEIFRDYHRMRIMPHLVKTNPNLGLTTECMNAAIKILKRELKGPFIQDENNLN